MSLLSKKQLAGETGVSVRTVEGWMTRKKIPYLKISDGLVRFRLDKVLAALDRYEIKAAR